MAAFGASFTKDYHHSAYPALDPSQPDRSAAAKVVFITGGSQGIGEAIARAFVLAQAAAVIITGRREPNLLEATEHLTAIADEYSSPSKVAYFVSDITDYAALSRVYGEVLRRFGPIDILVNNAAALGEVVSLSSSKPDSWWKVQESNVRGTYNVLHNFLRITKENSTIINISTFLAHLAIPGFSAYGASKIANLHMLDVLAKEKPSLRIHSFSPGYVDTPMNAGSHATPEDHVDLPGSFAVWLASPEAEFLAGRMVWANWDITELKNRQDEIVSQNLFLIGLSGYVVNPSG